MPRRPSLGTGLRPQKTELSEPKEPYVTSMDELVDTGAERAAAGLCSRSVPAHPGSWALPGASRATTPADEVRALHKQDSWQHSNWC